MIFIFMGFSIIAVNNETCVYLERVLALEQCAMVFTTELFAVIYIHTMKRIQGRYVGTNMERCTYYIIKRCNVYNLTLIC